MRERRGVHRVLVGKSEGRRPFWRPRRRWEDNIENGSSSSKVGEMDGIDLAEDRDWWRAVVNAAVNHPVP